jgi:hypothetical protein
VPPVVAQPVETPTAPAVTGTGKDTAPGRLKKVTGSEAQGKGRATAPGQQKKVDRTPAATAPAAWGNGKNHAPGRQKKGAAGAVVTTPTSPVGIPQGTATTPVTPAPATPADDGNGRGKAK